MKIGLAAEASPLLPVAEHELTEKQLRTSGDAQLLKAIELLSGQSQGGT